MIGCPAVGVTDQDIPGSILKGSKTVECVAVYGGFFIVLSYAWGWVFDKERPDTGATISCPILFRTARLHL